MAGYLGTKAVFLSTTAASVTGNSTITGDLTVDTNTLYVDSTNNRVGIGTSSPSANLDVSSSNATIHLTDTDDTTYAEIRNNGGTFTIASDEGAAASNSSINFRVDGTEAMRIDSNGNVGIGTTTPLGRLEIQDDTDISMNASANGHLVIDGLGYHFCVALDADAANLFTTSSSRDIVFGVDETEVMRVGNGHTFFGGKSSTGGSEYGAMFFKSGSSSVLFIDRQASDGDVAVFRRGGTEKGSIQVTATSTVYNTSSDYRLKEDVQPMVGASDRVMALNPVNFAWKENGLRVDGFLAHEAQEIVPEAVVGVKDGMQDEEYEVSPAVYDDDGNLVSEAIIGTRQVPKYQGIDQSKLVPLLTAALQEALTEIADLKARVTALETV